jgi:hypothetical protein
MIFYVTVLHNSKKYKYALNNLHDKSLIFLENIKNIIGYEKGLITINL